MSTRLTLITMDGISREREFVIDGPATCVVGRASDCDVQVPAGLEYGSVSRHHCLLAVVPSGAWVWDLGSRNATRINGQMVTSSKQPLAPSEAAASMSEGNPLHDGDVLQLGGVRFRVRVSTPPSGECADLIEASAER